MDLSNPGASMQFDEHIDGVPILEQLRAQRDCGRFCDVVFHVNRQEYLAHRNVLAASSRYFDSVFDINKSPREHVSVVCQDNSAFETVIEYIYTGKITIQRGNATELLRLSNHFMVTKLKDYCCSFLEENITSSTCFSIKSNADMCGCHSLSRQCHYFILCNISEVIRQNEILDFTFAKIEHILSNKLYSLRQEEKFQLILRWTKWDLAEREPFFRTLLSFVNWSCFSLDELYNSLKINDIYVNSNTCLYHLLQVLDSNGVDLQYHVDALQHIKSKIRALQPTLPSPQNNELTAAAPPAAAGPSSEPESQASPTAPAPVIQTTPNNPPKTQPPQEHIFCQNPALNTQVGVSMPFDETQNEAAVTPSTPLSIFSQQILPASRPVSIQSDLSNFDHDDCIAASGASGTDEPPSPQKDEVRVHKRKGIPFKTDHQTSEVIEREETGKQLGELTTRRVAKPIKRFPCEDYEETSSVTAKRTSVVAELPKEAGKEPNISKKPRFIPDKKILIPDKKIIAPSANSTLSPPRGPVKRGRKKKERLKCQHCDFLCCNETKLSAHLRSAHKAKDTYTCNICDFNCQWNREYYKHMKIHFKGPPFNCEYEGCTYSVDRIHTLLYHRMRHTGERPHHCHVCDQRFRTKNNLKTHMKSHSGERPYKCAICDRCFATKGTLDQHSVTHSNHRPFLCELCGFSTKYQSHLILHNRIHKGDVFKCQYPKCDYSTPKRSQLDCHMRTHLQVKSHMCKTCGRGFIEKSHLVRHERIHLQEKPFKCELCDYSSTRRDKLKDHWRKHHEEMSPSKAQKPTKRKTQTKQVIQATQQNHPESEAAPVIDVSNFTSLPTDEMMASADVESALGLDERELLRQSVVSATTTPGTMAMLTSSTIDTRSLGLLLPTVVSMDGRDEGDQDHFRASLMVDQSHMAPHADVSDPNPTDDAFLEQTGSLQLQPLQNPTLNPVADFQSSVSNTGRTSPDLPALSSLINIF